jgi:Spo0E like sporulation regulatory protein.
MNGKREMGQELDMKIEAVRNLLYQKIEENVDKKEILRISQELDKLIADYLMIQAI